MLWAFCRQLSAGARLRRRAIPLTDSDYLRGEPYQARAEFFQCFVAVVEMSSQNGENPQSSVVPN